MTTAIDAALKAEFTSIETEPEDRPEVRSTA